MLLNLKPWPFFGGFKHVDFSMFTNFGWEMFVKVSRMLLGHESCFQTCKRKPIWTQFFLDKNPTKKCITISLQNVEKIPKGSHPWQIFHVRVPESHGIPCLSPLDQDPDQPTGSQSDSPQENVRTRWISWSKDPIFMYSTVKLCIIFNQPGFSWNLWDLPLP